MPKREDPFKKIVAILKLPSGRIAVKRRSPYSMYGPPIDLKIRKK